MYKISIVTVTFNCHNVVEETINSVLSQDYFNKEYIIIDGASTDGTLSIIKRLVSDICTIISEKDKGIFDAMNKSLRYVTGDYVIFMNAGDVFVDTHVLSDIFNDYDDDDDLIYGDTYVQTKYGYRLKETNPIYTRPATLMEYVFQGQGICHQSLFTKTSILRQEQFNLAYPLGADYDTTVRVFRNGNHRLHYCGRPIAVFDDREGGASHNREFEVFKERIKMFNYHPTPFDYIYIYYKMIKQRIKNALENVFPTFVGRFRQKKYSSKLI